ncbi:hypothetical protein AUC69_04290 [Methyloceanibacter superfactus]|uniref:Lipoprotein n=1 Tax=Methyloceanibacter superfactus TaxID=1774969 RepID=A0A1E3VIT4_9HYPH|nr:hypothetical protein [Methyloceanibacter superfactus]ODR93427.1 hypothetical protein AUC69_04290 [Methyloceanibacter superfactus]
MKWLLIALMPFALAGCVTEQAPVLPMTLGPSEAAQASCLQLPDAPAFGDCKAQGTAALSQE